MHLNFRPFCLQPSPDLHQRLSHVRSASVALRAGPFPVCAHHVLDFAFPAEARQISKPNRVSSVRTGRSLHAAPHPVSPRRSCAQLLVDERSTRADFHLLFKCTLRRTLAGVPARRAPQRAALSRTREAVNCHRALASPGAVQQGRTPASKRSRLHGGHPLDSAHRRAMA